MMVNYAAHVNDKLINSDTAIMINIGWQKIVGPDSFHFFGQVLGLIHV